VFLDAALAGAGLPLRDGAGLALGLRAARGFLAAACFLTAFLRSGALFFAALTVFFAALRVLRSAP